MNEGFERVQRQLPVIHGRFGLVSLLTAILIVGCDTTDSPELPDPPEPERTGIATYLSLESTSEGQQLALVSSDLEGQEISSWIVSGLLDVHTFTGLGVSRNREKVAFTARNNDRTDLLIANSDLTSPVRHNNILNTGGSDITVRWGPSGKRILHNAFGSIVMQEFDDDNLQVGDPVPVTDGLRFNGDIVISQLWGFAWGPNESQAIVALGDPPPCTGGQGCTPDPFAIDLFLVDIARREVIQKLTDVPYRGRVPAIANGGRHVAFIEGSPPNREVVVITVSTGLERRLLLPESIQAQQGDWISPLRWTEDGRAVVYTQRTASAQEGGIDLVFRGVIDVTAQNLTYQSLAALPGPVLEPPFLSLDAP